MYISFISKYFPSETCADTFVSLASSTDLTSTSQVQIQINPDVFKRISNMKIEAHNYEHGHGVAPDMEMAVSLYREGAELGGAYAIFKLAGFYADGTIQPLSREMAAMWYGKGIQLHPHEPVFSGKLADLLTEVNLPDT